MALYFLYSRLMETLQTTHEGSRNIIRRHQVHYPRIKRLVRKTFCFSRSIELHDIVSGPFVNRYEFGLSV